MMILLTRITTREKARRFIEDERYTASGRVFSLVE